MSGPKFPTVEQLQQLPGPGFASMTPAGMVAPGDMVRTRSGWVLVDTVQQVGDRLALRCSDGSDHLTTPATLWHVNSGERWTDPPSRWAADAAEALAP